MLLQLKAPQLGMYNSSPIFPSLPRPTMYLLTFRSSVLRDHGCIFQVPFRLIMKRHVALRTIAQPYCGSLRWITLFCAFSEPDRSSTCQC
ncbi:hypothetical protein CPC08DRAFT_44031 [Agrocybe pediades]|nr:hypothetical protein CPC08DRAFT_44031 [Agrocybe pediades]